MKAFEKWLYRYGLRPQTVERHVENLRLFSETYLAHTKPSRILLDAKLLDVLKYLTKGLPRGGAQRRHCRLQKNSWRMLSAWARDGTWNTRKAAGTAIPTLPYGQINPGVHPV